MDIKHCLKMLLKKRSARNTERLTQVYTICIGMYEKQVDAIKDAANIEQIIDSRHEINIKAILVKKNLLTGEDIQDKVPK